MIINYDRLLYRLMEVALRKKTSKKDLVEKLD